MGQEGEQSAAQERSRTPADTRVRQAESWLKEASGLGGSKATPTVITPGLYRQRFLTFLDSSFLLVPDAWFTPADEAIPLHGSTSSSALYAAGGIISGKDAPATS